MVLEKTLESPLDCKEIQPVHPKRDQSWVFIGRTDAKAETPILWPPHVKTLTHWKRPWCWEGLGAGGEGNDRGWDGWMASLTQWTWVWIDSRSWWWTGRPGVLQFMGSQRVDWTELNWRPHYAFLKVCVNYYNCDKSCLGTWFLRLIFLITQYSVFCPETLPETCSYWLILHWSYLRMYALRKDVVGPLQYLRYPFYPQQPVDKYIIPVLTSQGGYSSTCFQCLLPEAFSTLFTLIKPCYTKLWATESVFGPGVKFFPSETTNPETPFTEHHKPSVVWTFFGIALLGIGMKIDLFQSCGHCWVFQICWHI